MFLWLALYGWEGYSLICTISLMLFIVIALIIYIHDKYESWKNNRKKKTEENANEE